MGGGMGGGRQGEREREKEGGREGGREAGRASLGTAAARVTAQTIREKRILGVHSLLQARRRTELEEGIRRRDRALLEGLQATMKGPLHSFRMIFNFFFLFLPDL